MRTVSRVAALLTSGVLLAGCGQETPSAAGPPETEPPEPVGEVLDLSGPGLHELPGAPLRPRDDAVLVWTGTELVAWGGHAEDPDVISSASFPGEIVGDGATLSLSDGRWTPMPPSPFAHGLYQPLGAWDGDELVIIGTDCVSEIPPATIGTPPPCPDGPAAAAWNPRTRAWRQLPDPPIPVDPGYREAVVTRGAVAVSGDGAALFAFGTEVTAIRWDGDTDSWSTADAPWNDGTQLTLCSDPTVPHLVVATEGSPTTSTVWTLEPGSTEWSDALELPVGVLSSISCGSGRLVVDEFGPDGSTGNLIDLSTGERTDAFEPTTMAELRNAWVVGSWLFSNSLTMTESEIVDTTMVRTLTGDWQELETGPLYFSPHDGVVVDGGVVSAHVGEDRPVTYWRAPPELAG